MSASPNSSWSYGRAWGGGWGCRCRSPTATNHRSPRHRERQRPSRQAGAASLLRRPAVVGGSVVQRLWRRPEIDVQGREDGGGPRLPLPVREELAVVNLTAVAVTDGDQVVGQERGLE